MFAPASNDNPLAVFIFEPARPESIRWFLSFFTTFSAFSLSDALLYNRRIEWQEIPEDCVSRPLKKIVLVTKDFLKLFFLIYS